MSWFVRASNNKEHREVRRRSEASSLAPTWQPGFALNAAVPCPKDLSSVLHAGQLLLAHQIQLQLLPLLKLLRLT